MATAQDTSTSPQPETFEFGAETPELLDLMIHSLYSHKEIFLRELISNASDALDKLRVARLSDEALRSLPETESKIELDADSEARTLEVSDNGVGMSRDELVSNLGTIARSGTKNFVAELKAARQAGEDLPELIGQFGVGFYAAFMVSEEVEVISKRAGDDQAWSWKSQGDGKFTVEPATRDSHGTSIRMRLKEIDKEESGAQDYTQEWVLREVVRKYSDFVEYPIQMEVTREETPRDDEGKEIEGADKETVIETVTLNSMKPIWTKSKSEVSDDEHAEFYKHLSHDWEPPLDTIHFRAEGATEYTALLYLPKRKPMGMFDPEEAKSRVSLYVKRVFITENCEELMPVWLRFVRGLVDSSDLPLNVSRETLQHARQLGQIKKRLSRKTLDAFSDLLENRREEYEAFWGEFGPVIKEGLYYDDDFRDDIAKRTLFKSTKAEGWTTLDEVVGRLEGEDAKIYVLSGPDMATVKSSPLLEAYAKRDAEVLLLTDQVDEFAFQRLSEYGGHSIVSIAKGDADLESEEEKKTREESEEQHRPLLDAIKEKLEDKLDAVNFSSRLTESAAVLVSSQHSMAPHVERMMRDAGQGAMGMPMSKRTLELNPEHPLVARLEKLRDDAPERFGDYCELLYGQALLAEGSPVEDPARFGRLVTELMVSE